MGMHMGILSYLMHLSIYLSISCKPVRSRPRVSLWRLVTGSCVYLRDDPDGLSAV